MRRISDRAGRCRRRRTPAGLPLGFEVRGCRHGGPRFASPLRPRSSRDARRVTRRVPTAPLHGEVWRPGNQILPDTYGNSFRDSGIDARDRRFRRRRVRRSGRRSPARGTAERRSSRTSASWRSIAARLRASIRPGGIAPSGPSKATCSAGRWRPEISTTTAAVSSPTVPGSISVRSRRGNGRDPPVRGRLLRPESAGGRQRNPGRQRRHHQSVRRSRSEPQRGPHQDLAIGVPFDGSPSPAAQRRGLDRRPVRQHHRPGLRRLAVPERESRNSNFPTASAHLGATLAAGFFDDDDFEDLAVGAPDKTVSGTVGAGAVRIFYGGAAGLSTTGPCTSPTTWSAALSARTTASAPPSRPAISTSRCSGSGWLLQRPRGRHSGGTRVRDRRRPVRQRRRGPRLGGGLDTSDFYSSDQTGTGDSGLHSRAERPLWLDARCRRTRRSDRTDLVVGVPNEDSNRGMIDLMFGGESGLPSHRGSSAPRAASSRSAREQRPVRRRDRRRPIRRRFPRRPRGRRFGPRSRLRPELRTRSGRLRRPLRGRLRIR